MGKKKEPNRNEQLSNVAKTAQTRYESTTTPGPAETAAGEMAGSLTGHFNDAVARQGADYSNMMGGYQDFRSRLGGPSKFSFNNVNAPNPAELNESYGYLREAAPGFRNFAQTGGYSPQDVQELRARGMSPIRSAYSNTMMNLDRTRAIGGAGGAPNYIAAASKAQREMPQQLADATTTVNATLADAIRQGKLAGLSGLSNVGGTMGGLASQQAGRQLQADLANQGADIQTQGMGEASLQNLRNAELGSLQGMTGLYGTTPGMANMFGNQALNAAQLRAGSEQARNQFGLGLLGTQMQGANAQTEGKPWWQTALNIAGTVAPFALAPFTGGTSLLGAGALLPSGSTTGGQLPPFAPTVPQYRP